METLIFFTQNEIEVLLALKQKKVGKGKRNGYGGRQEPDDKTIRHTACREAKEETNNGIICFPENLQPQTVIEFFEFGNTTDVPDHKVAIYTCSVFTGSAGETKEMTDPQWYDFSLDSMKPVPYSDMLPGDREFLPKILQREIFTGKVWFKENFSGIEKSEYITVSENALGV
jgi:8-oxo-dGTP pyrophosphatase MutT (NUDIX family)